MYSPSLLDTSTILVLIFKLLVLQGRSSCNMDFEEAEIFIYNKIRKLAFRSADHVINGANVS